MDSSDFSIGRIAAVAAVVVCLASCGPSLSDEHLRARVDEALNDVDRDRNSVRNELIELRQDIDHKILSTEEELLAEDVPEDERARKEQVLQELQDNRARVQDALIELERSDESSWLEVRRRSKSLTRSVDRWFERQAEQEDLRS